MSYPDGFDDRRQKGRTKPHPTRKVHPTVLQALGVLENAGVARFGFEVFEGEGLPDVPEAIRRLRGECGLSVGSSRSPGTGEVPHVRYSKNSGGAGDSDYLRAAIMAEACEPGNVGKLRGDAERRHLIRIDKTSGHAYVAATNEALPPELPDLPPEITDVWLWANEARVYVKSRSEPWMKHPIPEQVLASPETFEAV